MKLCHRIALNKLSQNFNTPSEIRAASDTLSFDGVYVSVYEWRALLLSKSVVLFPMGKYIGGDNSFDTGEPPSRFCDWQELWHMTSHGATIGWHSYSHPDLTTLPDEELEYEVMPPFGMDFFAYPYGRYDERVVRAVKKAGYKDAFSAGHLGDGEPFKRRRPYL